ncbi:MAG: cellulase family glycosylhydrolase [Candidatus Riflemargulisbacteria bacterium]
MSAMTKIVIFVVILILGVFMVGCGTVSNQTIGDKAVVINGQLRVERSTLKDSANQSIKLKGFCLTNGVYTETSAPPADHELILSTADYQTIQADGANIVRFYLQYSWLNDTNSNAFFTYMDEQLAMMATSNLKAIISLHYFGVNSSGSFYTGSQATKAQLQHFWKTISDRYVTNNVIAGYDLLNEPYCSDSFREDALYGIYEDIITEIRTNNDQHVIFISDPVNKFDNPNASAIFNLVGADAFKKLSDTNVVYQFHWYKPVEFTHQTVWNNDYFELGRNYPLTSYSGVTPNGGYRGGWYLESADHKINNTGLSWQTYTGSWVNLKQQIISDNTLDNSLSLFGVSLFCGGTNGDIEIDNITLNCRLASQTNNIWQINLPNSNFDYATKYTNNNLTSPSNYPANWSIASDLSSAQYTAELRNGVLYFKAATHSSYATWKHGTSKHTTYLTVSENYEYQIQARVKIQNNTLGDFYAGFEFYEAIPTVYDKQYILTNIESYYVNWANANGVPLYCGEWGVVDPRQSLGNYPNAPEQQVAWINDMSSILYNKGIHWTYHDYKNYDNLGFGVFDINSKTEIKQALQNAF